MVAQKLVDVRGLISLLSPTNARVRLVSCTAGSLGRRWRVAPCLLQNDLRTVKSHCHDVACRIAYMTVLLMIHYMYKLRLHYNTKTSGCTCMFTKVGRFEAN